MTLSSILISNPAALLNLQVFDIVIVWQLNPAVQANLIVVPGFIEMAPRESVLIETELDTDTVVRPHYHNMKQELGATF